MEGRGTLICKCDINDRTKSDFKSAALTESSDVLQDLLSPGLDLVICGTASGKESAAEKAYYAHNQNKFWAILAETKLTSSRLAPEEYMRLLEFGIGLTDLAKHYSGTDKKLPGSEIDVTGFKEKIKKAHPRILAFNGKNAASIFFDVPKNRICYGRQEAKIGETEVFVLTQTSGSNAHWKSKPWHECARIVRDKRSARLP